MKYQISSKTLLFIILTLISTESISQTSHIGKQKKPKKGKYIDEVPGMFVNKNVPLAVWDASNGQFDLEVEIDKIQDALLFGSKDIERRIQYDKIFINASISTFDNFNYFDIS